MPQLLDMSAGRASSFVLSGLHHVWFFTTILETRNSEAR